MPKRKPVRLLRRASFLAPIITVTGGVIAAVLTVAGTVSVALLTRPGICQAALEHLKLADAVTEPGLRRAALEDHLKRFSGCDYAQLAWLRIQSGSDEADRPFSTVGRQYQLDKPGFYQIEPTRGMTTTYKLVSGSVRLFINGQEKFEAATTFRIFNGKGQSHFAVYPLVDRAVIEVASVNASELR